MCAAECSRRRRHRSKTPSKTETRRRTRPQRVSGCLVHPSAFTPSRTRSKVRRSSTHRRGRTATAAFARRCGSRQGRSPKRRGSGFERCGGLGCWSRTRKPRTRTRADGRSATWRSGWTRRCARAWGPTRTRSRALETWPTRAGRPTCSSRGRRWGAVVSSSCCSSRARARPEATSGRRRASGRRCCPSGPCSRPSRRVETSRRVSLRQSTRCSVRTMWAERRRRWQPWTRSRSRRSISTCGFGTSSRFSTRSGSTRTRTPRWAWSRRSSGR